MHFAKVYSAQTTLLAGKIISVEVDISKKTLQAFTIVGKKKAPRIKRGAFGY